MNDIELLHAHHQRLLEWQAVDRTIHISLVLMLLLLGSCGALLLLGG